MAALTAACGGGSKPADDKKVEAKAADTKVAPVDEAVAKRKAERLAFAARLPEFEQLPL